VAAANPRLRPVEAFVVRSKGREMVALHDPMRYSEEIVLVSAEAMLILSAFDGTRDVRQVQEELMRQTGQLLPTAEIDAMLAKLDEAHLLDNENFAAFLAGQVAKYAALADRPALLAGQAYPKEAEEIRKTLDGYFLEAAKLPDDALHAGAAAARIVLPAGFERESPADEGGAVRGLIAPHIDPRRGGACIAKAYAKARNDPADLYVIFGTAHGECDAPYALTRKNYATPLGVAETDRALVDSLVSTLGPEPLADEFVHKTEHSIEFQVLFLQHALAGKAFRILPILCGSLHPAVIAGMSPDLADMRVARFHFTLASELAKGRGKICFIAGADFSHIGMRFGDRQGPRPRPMRPHLTRRSATIATATGCAATRRSTRSCARARGPPDGCCATSSRSKRRPARWSPSPLWCCARNPGSVSAS